MKTKRPSSSEGSERLTEVADFYDEFAPTYDHSRYATLKQQRKDAVAKGAYLELAGDTKGKKHLDVGCGTGRLVQAFSDAGSLPVGLDPSKNMLKVAKEKVPDATFKQGSALDLPFRDNAFDIVTCSQVLTHLGEYDTPLAEMARVAKRNGTVLFDIRNACNGMNQLNSIRYRLFGGAYRPHYVSLRHIKRALERAGLEFVEGVGTDTRKKDGFGWNYSQTLLIKAKKP